jgi:hypothetical protein
MKALARSLSRLALPCFWLVACGDDGGSSQTGTGGGSAATGVGDVVTSTGDAMPSTSASGGGDGGGMAQASTGAAGGAAEGGFGGAGGAMTMPYEPDPIPDVPDTLPPPCQAAIDSTYYFEFLDDVCDKKRVPAVEDRAFACPSVDTSPIVTLADGSTVTYAPATAPIVVDGNALAGIVPSAMRVAVILIRRVNGIPHYRYLSNGTHDTAIQPWSTTKFLAAANAAATLRVKSNYKVGLTAKVDGKAVGDLVTSVVNYDDMPYSSNGLGRYFHDVGGRAKANDLIHGAWLGRPANETFGGNYGSASPPLGFTFVEGDGSTVTIAPDGATGYANNLSMLTLAEATKRLVLHREDSTTRLPGIQWKDLEVLFYGAAGSSKGPFGGMSADTAIYLQTGHDIDYLDQRSHGQYRVFSKLGLGTQGQFLDVGYACFPVLDDQEQAVPGWGREFVIAAELASGGATWKERDRLLATAYRAIVERIVDGRL